MAFQQLQKSGVIPIRINAEPMKHGEINGMVSCLLAQDSPQNQPIAQWLIDQIGPDHPIREKARLLGRYVQGVVLPGGEDIPSTLSGIAATKSEDYKRVILELSLIGEAEKKGIPLLAICRGFQIFNLYHGAKIVQDIGLQNKIFSLDQVDPGYKGVFGTFFAERPNVQAHHHQAVTTENLHIDPLQIRAVDGKVVYAVENMYGAPQIGTQFHPESFQTATASDLIDLFSELIIQKVIDKQNKNSCTNY